MIVETIGDSCLVQFQRGVTQDKPHVTLIAIGFDESSLKSEFQVKADDAPWFGVGYALIITRLASCQPGFYFYFSDNLAGKGTSRKVVKLGVSIE